MKSSDNPSILFQFIDLHTAQQARDTFEELGYDPIFQDEHVGQPPIVAVQVIDEDLTSALEIGQAFGGKLLEQTDADYEEKTMAMAYDLQEGAVTGQVDRLDATGPEEERPDSDEGPLYGVSSEAYDHFSADVRA